VISYTLGEPARVHLAIYDGTGRLVERLSSGYQAAGSYVAEWDARGVAPGVYLYRLVAGDHAAMNRCVVLE
jgi:flagellar hook assembly protein FlgD